MISKTKKSVARALGYLKSEIEERKTKMAELGEDWDDKPVGHLLPVFFPASRVIYLRHVE